MINDMVRSIPVIGILSVLMFLSSFLYVYTIFVDSVEAQSANTVAVNWGETIPIGETIQKVTDITTGSRSGDYIGGGSRGAGTKLENPLENPIAFKSLGALISAILDIIVQIAVPIAALFLMYSGFLFISARGDEAQLKTAKSIFLWTMVGIAVLLGAEILAQVIQGTINQLKR